MMATYRRRADPYLGILGCGKQTPRRPTRTGRATTKYTPTRQTRPSVHFRAASAAALRRRRSAVDLSSGLAALRPAGRQAGPAWPAQRAHAGRECGTEGRPVGESRWHRGPLPPRTYRPADPMANAGSADLSGRHATGGPPVRAVSVARVAFGRRPYAASRFTPHGRAARVSHRQCRPGVMRRHKSVLRPCGWRQVAPLSVGLV